MLASRWHEEKAYLTGRQCTDNIRGARFDFFHVLNTSHGSTDEFVQRSEASTYEIEDVIGLHVHTRIDGSIEHLQRIVAQVDLYTKKYFVFIRALD